MWERAGYTGGGNVSPLLGAEAGKTAVIAGSGRGVFDEVNLVLEAYPEAVVFAVNDAGMYLPVFHHWVSLHADKINAWTRVRGCDASMWQAFKTHSIREGSGVDFHWSGLSHYFVLSGYFAAQIAHLMGCEQIILCGCPGDGMPRFFESMNGRADHWSYNNKNVLEQLLNEMKRVPAMKAKIKSMSGWTRHYFGSPSPFYVEHLFEGG